MAGGKSDDLENKLLDHVLGGGDYTRLSTVYVALYTATPNDAGGGTEVSTSGTAYARVAVTNNATNFPAASSGVKANGTAITFAKATADWGTVVAWAIKSLSSGGVNLYWGPVNPNKVVSTDDTPSFAAGDLSITED